MSRETYRGVSPETKAAIEGFVKEIAYEMDVEPQYLYAILSGKEPDPFKKFKRVFRATARKNKKGARGFIAELNSILLEADPQPVAGQYELDAAFWNLKAVMAAREGGHASPEQVDEARNRFVELLGGINTGVGVMSRGETERDLRQSGGGFS